MGLTSAQLLTRSKLKLTIGPIGIGFNTIKDTRKQASEQASKQAIKQGSKQASKQANTKNKQTMCDV
jgi:hypothetical protein